jgi:hypothetical protein
LTAKVNTPKKTQHWLHPPHTPTSKRYSPLMKRTEQIIPNKPALNTPKPLPVYIQDVTSIPPLLQLLEQVAPRSYETKALAKKPGQNSTKIV